MPNQIHAKWQKIQSPPNIVLTKINKFTVTDNEYYQWIADAKLLLIIHSEFITQIT